MASGSVFVYTAAKVLWYCGITCSIGTCMNIATTNSTSYCGIGPQHSVGLTLFEFSNAAFHSAGELVITRWYSWVHVLQMERTFFRDRQFCHREVIVDPKHSIIQYGFTTDISVDKFDNGNLIWLDNPKYFRILLKYWKKIDLWLDIHPDRHQPPPSLITKWRTRVARTQLEFTAHDHEFTRLMERHFTARQLVFASSRAQRNAALVTVCIVWHVW